MQEIQNIAIDLLAAVRQKSLRKRGQLKQVRDYSISSYVYKQNNKLCFVVRVIQNTYTCKYKTELS